MNDEHKIIYAQAVLISPSGKSITGAQPVAGNISELLPSAQTKKTVTVFLEKNGFNVNTNGPTLSISGKKSLFEKVFHFSIQLNSKDGQEYATAVTKPIIPPGLQPHLKEIVFSEPAAYFG